MRGHRVFARIRNSLPLEVLIDRVALHKIAPYSAYKVNNDFLVLEKGFEGRIRLFYKIQSEKGLRLTL